MAPAKLGVATIFDALRREGLADGAIGVVSGALVIVPDGALAALEEAAEFAVSRRTMSSASPCRMARATGGSASVARAGTGSSG